MSSAPATSRPTPLLPVLLFSFTNSFGSAVVYSGLYSLAKWNYAFSPRACVLLALLYGIMYIPGAVGVGPLLRRLPAGSRLFNHRALLAAIMALMTALCLLPWLASRFDAPGAAKASWPIWLLCALYSPLSGMMWPVVESYVAGARSGSDLRGAVGKFNVAWSSALAVTLFTMAPLVKDNAIVVLSILAGVHALNIGLLPWFLPRPGAHVHDDHEPHPDSYAGLLRCHQVLLLVAFLCLSALSPYLTTAFERLSIPANRETPLIAVWMVSRVLTFLLMERWHGWRGRWLTPIVGSAVLLASAATVLLAPVLLAPSIAIWVLVAGLIGFGAGVGCIYYATLYYSMAVGSAEVDAAGMFETLIGIGYTLGPLCGFLAGEAVLLGYAPPGAAQPITVVLLTLLAAIGIFIAIFRAVRVVSPASSVYDR